MKVYLRVWNPEGGYEQLQPYNIDSYYGLWMDESTTKGLRLPKGVKPQTLFIHASEPNALVMYCVREKETKETKPDSEVQANKTA